jgi:hypothetical protein
VAHRKRPDAAADRADKTCVSCGRRIQWRAKWADDWDAVRYCSDACRRRGVTLADEALEADLLRKLIEVRAVTVGDEEPLRRAARRLVARSGGDLVLSQSGHAVDPSTAKGPFQLTKTS